MEIYKKILNFYLVGTFFTFCQVGQKDGKKFSSLVNLVFLKNKDSDSSNSSVESSKPNLNIQDPLYKDQWYLKNTGQFGGTPGIDINVEPVWKQGYKGNGINISILDNALGLKQGEVHEDLKDNINVNKSHNFINYLCDVSHGTSVTGIVAARDNNIGVRGIAPRSKIYSYGILPLSGSADATRVFVKNIEEVAVVNSSWGIFKPSVLPKVYKDALEKGLKDGFYNKGTVYVFAAGNDPKINTSIVPFNNFYGSIVVNSLDNDGKHQKLTVSPSLNTPFRFSIGSDLWISAPGYKIYTTNSFCDKNDRLYTNNFSATSSAAPMVTGVVALIREANRNLTWRDVKLILAETTTKNDPTHSSWIKGNSKKSNSAENYYFNNHYGFGMVNADKAVRLAKNWSLLPPMKVVESSKQVDLSIDTKKSSSIKIENSGINFIEFVLLELNIDKQINIQDFQGFELKLTHKEKKSNIYMKEKYVRLSDSDKGGKNIILNMATNVHLGAVADGDWILQIQAEKVFNKLKSWKLIIRGH